MTKKKAKKKATAKPKYSVHALLRANALLSEELKKTRQDVEHFMEISRLYYLFPPGGERAIKQLEQEVKELKRRLEARDVYSQTIQHNQSVYIGELEEKVRKLETQLASVSPETD